MFSTNLPKITLSMAKRTMEEFVDTRVEMLCADGQKMYGWIQAFSPYKISIQCNSECRVSEGDNLQLHALSHRASTKTVVKIESVERPGWNRLSSDETGLKPMVLHCQLTENLRLESPREGARSRVRSLPAKITLNDTEFDAEVVDVSRQGIAVRTKIVVPENRDLRITVISEDGPVTVDGKVRYCKPEPGMQRTVRMGVQLGEMGRLEAKKWSKQLAA